MCGRFWYFMLNIYHGVSDIFLHENSLFTLHSLYILLGILSETQQTAKQNHNESEQLKSKCSASSMQLCIVFKQEPCNLPFSLWIVKCYSLYRTFCRDKWIEKKAILVIDNDKS